MPKVNDTPKMLKPYLFHGLDLDPKPGGSEATGECPFCGKEGKFSINIETGQSHCWYCNVSPDGKSGMNVTTFMRLIHERSMQNTSQVELDTFARDRGLFSSETLVKWGVCKSIVTGQWLMPGYSFDGKLCNLYRYSRDYEGKMRWFCTHEVDQAFHMPVPFNNALPNVYVCEGISDGMVLWEMMRVSKMASLTILPDGSTSPILTTTGNHFSSLLGTANIIAVPGCNIFKESWLPLFASKKVTLLYDNDQPRMCPKTNKPIKPAALVGLKRVANLLTNAENQPNSVHFLQWGAHSEQGERGGSTDTNSSNSGIVNYTMSLANGYDVRDYLTSQSIQARRIEALGSLLGMVRNIPSEWVDGGVSTSVKGRVEVDCLECTDWDTLTTAWKKALKWIPGLDIGLGVMLSCVASTDMKGDQLWIKIVSPPSTGKSVLSEALAVARRYVKAVSKIKGMYSGYQSDKEGTEDNSLVERIRGKTLIIKDGDTLLKSATKDVVLSELRDLFDKVARTTFLNKMSRDYYDVRFGCILCGTESLREIDNSELGQRFLDYVIMGEIEVGLEREINARKGSTFFSDRTLSNSEVDSRDEPSLLNARQLTGGYVNYLRENMEKLWQDLEVDVEKVNTLCSDLAIFISLMRARPSLEGSKSECATREMSPRLCGQLNKLAACMAIVMSKPGIDDTILKRVTHVAMDTSRGKTLDIMKYLYKVGSEGKGVQHKLVDGSIQTKRRGASCEVIGQIVGIKDKECLNYLNFLVSIKVLERYTENLPYVPPGQRRIYNGHVRYRVRDNVHSLYTSIVIPFERERAKLELESLRIPDGR